MKLRILFFLLIAQQSFAQNFKEVELKSTIKEVTVFTQGAQIARQGKMYLITGKSAIVLKFLSPHIDERSVQVKGIGNFTILSVNHRLNYLNETKKDAALDSLQTLINKIDATIATKNARLEVLKVKLSVLNANKALGGQNAGVSLTQLKQAIDLFDKELTAIKTEDLKVHAKIKELKERRNKLALQAQKAKNTTDLPTSEIVIRVESEAKLEAKFSITYLVANAGWFPKYDVRVKDVQSPIVLNYKADVYQNTGVDWKNVKMKFSNGNPNQSGIAPSLNTWYLNYARNTWATREPKLESDDAYLSETVVAESLQGKASGVRIRGAASAPKKSKVVQTTTIENQTTVEFEVKTPYSIKSNGEKLTVDLKSYDIESIYEYYAVPKLDKDAFLIARIINWDQYNLLEGEANLYFEDAYVGRSILDAKSLSDTLNISLGRDKNIVIGRDKVDDFSKKRTVGTNKIDSRGFKITVRNKKSQPIKLTVIDQIPIASISDISISPNELSGGELDVLTGEVKWELNLGANSQKELMLKYSVKYPKKEKVVLE